MLRFQENWQDGMVRDMLTVKPARAGYEAESMSEVVLDKLFATAHCGNHDNFAFLRVVLNFSFGGTIWTLWRKEHTWP